MSTQLSTAATTPDTSKQPWSPDSKWWLVDRRYLTRDRDFVDVLIDRGLSAYMDKSFHDAVFRFRELHEMDVDTLAWYVLHNGLFTTDAQQAFVAYEKVEKRGVVIFVTTNRMLAHAELEANLQLGGTL